MKKMFFFILSLVLLFVFSTEVKADKGDLIYEVQNFVLTDSSITISGYAFIHETNNYVTVYKRNSSGHETSEIIKSDGGQKTKIVIKNSSGNKKVEFIKENENDNYNFYYQQYYQPTGSPSYSLDTYNNVSINRCQFYRGSADNNDTKCYYEDIGFEIEIPIIEMLSEFSYGEEIKFYIAVYNNHYGNWSELKEMKITKISGSSNNIKIEKGEPKGKMKASVGVGLFQKINEQVKYTFNGNAYSATTGGTYYIYSLNEGFYNNGFLQGLNIDYLGYGFLRNTFSPGKYAVCVNLDTGRDACSVRDGNDYCTECNVSTPGEDGVQLVSLFGSWVMFEGTNQLIIKINGRKCSPPAPSVSTDLNCNSSKTLESTCDRLTVNTAYGSADVTIEQTGTISSVLTPSKTFAGGGFNFGVLYQNSIKWSYVGVDATGNLHNAVKNIMEGKIKEYNNYINNINITELSFNGIPSSILLEKSCTATSPGNDYYNNELTVSCVFTFPEAELSFDGSVSYHSNGININNKYYTPINYDGDYTLSAKITGMSRIKDAASDSMYSSQPWTGNWDNNNEFKNCIIEIYPLFYKNSPGPSGNTKYNFIYRPIDLNNPFPNRIAGINWFDWYNTSGNPERLSNAYNNLEYTARLDNSAISNIKTYNRGRNYLNWDNIDINGKSSFIDSYSYVNRESGS